MNTRFKFAFFLVIFLFISACGQNNLPAPSCRVNANYISNHQGPAACIIVKQGKLLTKQLNSGQYDLVHGGASQLRSAQCSAHYAMWQQTGLNVEIENVVGVFDDGTWLFGCNLESGFDGSEEPFKAPAWSSPDVDNILFIDPFTIEHKNWRDPARFITVRDAYIEQKNYQKQTKIPSNE